MKTVLLVLLLFAAANSRAMEVSFTGYVKSYAITFDEVDIPLFEAPRSYQSQNAARFMLEGFSDTAVWQIHYEINPVFISRRLQTDFGLFRTGSKGYRYSDLDASLTDDRDDKNQVYQNLDRFNVQFQFESGDLTIGRQAIGFGSARSVNPTDVFLPFDIRTIDTEYLNGVDAVRFQAPWGELGEIDVGVVLGEEAKTENSAAYLQIGNNHAGADYKFTVMEFADQQMVSAAVQTALGDFGFWLEAAAVHGDEDYTRVTAGLDYSLSENTTFIVEYHYNGAGSDDPEDYFTQFDTTPYRQGGVFLLGRNYLLAFINRQVTPLWTLNGAVFYNFSDDSVFTQINAEYNIADDVYINLGYYHFSGDEIIIDPLGRPEFQSEYGPNPNIFYAAIRYYF